MFYFFILYCYFIHLRQSTCLNRKLIGSFTARQNEWVLCIRYTFHAIRQHTFPDNRLSTTFGMCDDIGSLPLLVSWCAEIPLSLPSFLYHCARHSRRVDPDRHTIQTILHVCPVCIDTTYRIYSHTLARAAKHLYLRCTCNDFTSTHQGKNANRQCVRALLHPPAAYRVHWNICFLRLA